MSAGQVAVAAALVLGACSSREEAKADKQRECDVIAEDIRKAAVAYGIPSEGVCNSAKAPQLTNACTSLSKCNKELADL